MDKKIVSVAIVAVIAGLLLGYMTGYFGTNVASLNQRISELDSQNDELESDLNAVNSQVSQLQSQITEKNAGISSLESQLANMNQLLTNLQAERTSLIQEIEDLEGTITQLESQIENQILGVYFSPDGGCEDQVLYWIDRANSSIEILIYSFTLDSIGDALIEAHNRGVEIQVVFEVSQISQYSEYLKLKEAGIDVRNDTNSNLMHDKIMIIDGIIVLTGSFNYSNAAEESNNENLLIINSTTIAMTYGEEFTRIWDVSIAEEEETPPTPPQTIDVEITYVSGPGEYVVIENNGAEDVDMTDWTLSDLASHIFWFPNFILKTGKTVTVYTTVGTDTNDQLYWNRHDNVWNNDHDTAFLRDTSLNLIDSYSY